MNWDFTCYICYDWLLLDCMHIVVMMLHSSTINFCMLRIWVKSVASCHLLGESLDHLHLCNVAQNPSQGDIPYQSVANLHNWTYCNVMYCILHFCVNSHTEAARFWKIINNKCKNTRVWKPNISCTPIFVLNQSGSNSKNKPWPQFFN